MVKGAIKKRKLIPPSHSVRGVKVAQVDAQTERSKLMFDPYLTSIHRFVRVLVDNLAFSYEHFMRYSYRDDESGDEGHTTNRTTKPKRRMKDQDRANLHAMLMAVISNLALSAAHGTRPPSVGVMLRSSRDKVTRYHRPAFTGLPKLLDNLAKAEVGFKLIRSVTKGISSALVANAALEETLGRFAFGMDDFQRIEGSETVWLSRKKHDYILKTHTTELIDYRDTPETIRYRAEMQTINEALKAADLTLNGSPIPTTSRQLRRHFSLPKDAPEGAERFDLGGRLFGGRWLDLKKLERKGIRVAGEANVELDFSSLFLRLAYLEAGVTPPKGDLYAAVQGFSEPQWRDGVKRVVNALFFRSTPLSRVPEDAKELLPSKTTGTAIRGAILAAHPALASVIERGLGLSFMFVESQILVAALLRLAAQGVPVLPIHDGILCAKSKAAIVHEAMSEASMQITGFYLPISMR